MLNQSVEQQAISISYSLPIKYIYPVIIRELHFTKFCQE